MGTGNHLLHQVLIPGVLFAFGAGMACFGILGFHSSWSSKTWNLCSLPAGVNVLLFYFQIAQVMQPVLGATNDPERAFNVRGRVCQWLP